MYVCMYIVQWQTHSMFTVACTSNCDLILPHNYLFAFLWLHRYVLHHTVVPIKRTVFIYNTPTDTQTHTHTHRYIHEYSTANKL